MEGPWPIVNFGVQFQDAILFNCSINVVWLEERLEFITVIVQVLCVIISPQCLVTIREKLAYLHGSGVVTYSKWFSARCFRRT